MLLALQKGTMEEKIAFTFSVVADDADTLDFEQLRDVLSVRAAAYAINHCCGQSGLLIYCLHDQCCCLPMVMQ